MTSITDTVYYQLFLNQTLEVVLGKYFFFKAAAGFQKQGSGFRYKNVVTE